MLERDFVITPLIDMIGPNKIVHPVFNTTIDKISKIQQNNELN